MNEKIKFRCKCGKKLNALVALAGKQARCSGCGNVITVPQPLAKPEIGIKASPVKVAAPAPPAVDYELDLEDLEESPASVPKKAPASPPKNAAGPPKQSTAAPATGKSIWDEEDEYQLSAPLEPPCPKCGAAMQSSAKVCMACGYNRSTGVQAPTATLGPLTAKSSRRNDSWLKRTWARGTSKGSMYWNFIVLAAGVAFFFLGINERKLADASSAEPERITLSQLLQRGPEGNPNLILTDYELCDDLVYETKSTLGVSVGGWTKVWVPIVPRTNAPDTIHDRLAGPAASSRSQSIRALIMSTNVGNEEEVGQKLAGPELRGMVTNRVASLNNKEKKFLQQGYPGVNFDRVIIFQAGREPSGSGLIMAYFAGGSLLFIAGIGLLAKRFLTD